MSRSHPATSQVFFSWLPFPRSPRSLLSPFSFVNPSKRGPGSTDRVATLPVRLSLRGYDGNFKRFLPIIALFTLSNSSDFFLLLRAQSAGVSVKHSVAVGGSARNQGFEFRYTAATCRIVLAAAG